MNRAGITKKGSCHLFRHTAASLMLDAGRDIRHLQAILGYENLSTTQIYTHVSIGKLCEVHDRTHPARLFRRQRPESVIAKRRPYARLFSSTWLAVRHFFIRQFRSGRPSGQSEP